MGKSEFTWIDTYKAITFWLSKMENKQNDLIKILKEIGINKFIDRDTDNTPFTLNEIDPFTFFSYLNKYGDIERLKFLQTLHKKLDFKTPIPSDVEGIPTINAMKVWLFAYKRDRNDTDIPNLWKIFKQAVNHQIEDELFQEVLKIKCVGKGKLSICLFYCDPEYYLTLDTRTSKYLRDKGLEYSFNTYLEYQSLINEAKNKLKKNNWEISKNAWQYIKRRKLGLPNIELGVIKEDVFEINDIKDLIGYITDLLDKEDLHSDIYYRGHSNKEYRLVPQIYRLSPNGKDYVKCEDIMHKELIGLVPSEFQQYNSTFEKLVKMQHYGLPTRLLDITSNPLIALYFACKEENITDALLFRFEIDKDLVKYYDSDTVSVISNISRRPITFAIDKLKYSINESDDEAIKDVKCKEFNETNDISYLLHEIGTEKPHFKPLVDIEDIEKVVCVKPKMDNPRIIKQEGAFLLFGIKDDKSKCATCIPTQKIFLIKGSNKEKIRKQLDALGINESTLFPDIDHISKHLKEKFGT